MISAGFYPRGLVKAAVLAGMLVWRPMSVSAQLALLAPLPDNGFTAQRFLREGRAYYATGRYALAYRRYEAVLTLDPGNALALEGEKQIVAAQAGADERGQALEEKLSGDWRHPVLTWYGYANGEFASRRDGRDRSDQRHRMSRASDLPLRETWLYRAAKTGEKMTSEP